MAYELRPQLLRTQERTLGGLMKYTSIKDERKSNSNSTMMKRLLVLLMITMGVMLSGVQSAPTVHAGAPCEMVCTEFIDPTDGQCYTRCCPEESTCKIRCVIMPCEK